MSTITLTDKQNAGIKEAKDWFFSFTDPRPIFTIAGYAGTGKSTIVKFLIDELGLAEEEVVFAAYTGMATSVLIRKGNRNANTIHKLIYDAFPIKNEETGMIVGFNYTLKEKLDNEKLRLVVIDEWSMVNQKMIEELMEFKIKIIAIGDPGQLPPIAGGNTLLQKPDVFLDEILRQALDNPIIYLSMLARNGETIKYGTHGNAVQVVRKDELYPEMFSMADQIIAGRNQTVHDLNKFHRRHILGIEDPFPIVGDKVVCLKNDWNYMISEGDLDMFLVNGLIGNITSIENKRKAVLYQMGFKPTFMEEESFDKLFVDKTNFLNKNMQDAIDHKALYMFRKNIIEQYGIQEFQFGYTITCHKSQGSEFDNVLGFNEILNRKLHKNWLYTLITRAKEKLILAL